MSAVESQANTVAAADGLPVIGKYMMVILQGFLKVVAPGGKDMSNSEQHF